MGFTEWFTRRIANDRELKYEHVIAEIYLTCCVLSFLWLKTANLSDQCYCTSAIQIITCS